MTPPLILMVRDEGVGHRPKLSEKKYLKKFFRVADGANVPQHERLWTWLELCGQTL